MPAKTKWEFDADYFTFCNCDWGCPCNFNARPTHGNCHGVGAWRIRSGAFDGTRLDGVTFVGAYFFPGLIENGNGTVRFYVDRRASPDQRKAIDAISSGRAGGGIFEVFAKLASNFLPPVAGDIELDIEAKRARLWIPGIMEAEAALLKYPDGLVIEPTFTLPHGIEFKTGLALNATYWWIKDDPMLARYENVYAVVSRVRFTEKGCVA